MSDVKWTAGPWHITDVTDGRAAINDAEGKAVADTWDLQKNQDHEANAHLIAAAPELYEALDNLMSALGGGKKNCGHEFDCCCPFDQARVAAAKARGEQQ